MESPFHTLADCGVPLLIIGGHALSAHGYSRLTLDYDCLICIEDGSKLREHMERSGYREVFRNKTFAKFQPRGRETPVVDALFVDRSTFEKLSAGKKAGTFAGVPLFVPAVLHLIALKLHAVKCNPLRELQDLADIAQMLAHNPGSVSTSELREICGRYGPEGVYSRIEAHVKP
jgi:hypothetical protein